MAEADDLIAEGRKQFTLCADAEQHNRTTGLDDIKFARGGEQWHEKIKAQRELEGRPCLTINKMPAFIRQVVNDARQNKPSIKVHPVDSGADPETAEVINGLIRNIEYTSNADVAYDTATECAVGNGWGYIRIGLDYAYDDSFDLDLSIERVANPFSIYGDPHSGAADSSDWNVAFVTDRISKAEFERRFKGKSTVDWDDTEAWGGDVWREGEQVTIAEWWSREEVERPIVQLSNGLVVPVKQLEARPDLLMLLNEGMLQVTNQRMAKTCEVTQRIMSGAEVLDKREWPGKYIPIVPVYGDEFDIEGKRYFRSLIHNAVDAQRMVNYWKTTATELVALAPKAPFLVPDGAIPDAEVERWNTANTVSHPYLTYNATKGTPTRLPLDSGPAAGAMQEALSASDDMKAIIGLYDASLGARSNETSGKAIMARQREGDVATFHFIDNMARAIRHVGRILIDLIPHVYSAERVIRVIGEDGTPDSKPVNQQYPVPGPNGQPQQQPVMGPNGQPMVQPNGQPMMKAVMAMHDLRVGKYDLTVTTGPSFTTRRQEAAVEMTEFVRAFPAAAPLIGDLIAKNLDWPGADEIAKRMQAMLPPQAGGGVPPEVQKQLQMIPQLQQENAALKQDQANAAKELAIKEQEARTKQYEAVTDRLRLPLELQQQADAAMQTQAPPMAA